MMQEVHAQSFTNTEKNKSLFKDLTKQLWHAAGASIVQYRKDIHLFIICWILFILYNDFSIEIDLLTQQSWTSL